ncbi:hypothetical protein BH09VER1_BH09VER1_28810 [soil metagenome]
MRRLIAIATMFLCLAGCQIAPPVPAPANAGWQKNACVPEAAEMAQGLKKADIQARVLIINTTQYSHAICVYLYPTGENQLWAWDSGWKSIRLRAYWDDANGMASAWLSKCNTGRGEALVSGELL